MGEVTDGKPLKIREAAERLSVSQGTIRNAIERGRLVAYRFEGAIRIMPVDLAAYQDRSVAKIQSPEVKPPAPKATPLRHLDGARSRAAWEKQGIIVKPEGTIESGGAGGA